MFLTRSFLAADWWSGSLTNALFSLSMKKWVSSTKQASLRICQTFAWSALRLFMSIPACDWSIWLFWFTSLWRKFSQRGSPLIENEHKNISTWYNFFNYWSNHAKLSDFDYYIAVLWVWKLERKLLKNWTLNICSVQIQWGFSDAPPFYSTGSWVSALSGSAASDLLPSECWMNLPTSAQSNCLHF